MTRGCHPLRGAWLHAGEGSGWDSSIQAAQPLSEPAKIIIFTLPNFDSRVPALPIVLSAISAAIFPLPDFSLLITGYN